MIANIRHSTNTTNTFCKADIAPPTRNVREKLRKNQIFGK